MRLSIKHVLFSCFIFLNSLTPSCILGRNFRELSNKICQEKTIQGPLGFSFFKKYSLLNPPKERLPRAPSVQNDYDKHRNNLLTHKVSITQYLLETLFPRNEAYIFTKNSFPYFVKKGVCHDLLWLNPNIFKKKVLVSKINELVRKRFGDQEVVFFENTNENKSVKLIRHIHLFYLSESCF